MEPRTSPDPRNATVTTSVSCLRNPWQESLTSDLDVTLGVAERYPIADLQYRAARDADCRTQGPL